jgi:hypothetical protein
MSEKTNPYAGHQYPTEIISYAVWLYFRFTLRLRDIEELLAYRGVIRSGPHQLDSHLSFLSDNSAITYFYFSRICGV